jgi:CRISPR-associated endonuclease/helicase Cas3
VAALAEPFAAAFGAAAWGRLAGLWHDLGKASNEFQRYIRYHSEDPNPSEESNDGGGGRVDHSTFGARHAVGAIPNVLGQLLAFCIAGHHAGLADATTAEDALRRSTLSYRLDSASCAVPHVPSLPVDGIAPANLKFPLATPANGEMGFAFAFFTRMLFSCLVDADRTATEAFCDPARAAERNGAKPTLDDLREALDEFLRRKQREAPPTPVNAIRARVLGECLRAASLPPGFFSLNVPTGGGKTFASLAFALHHARHHRDEGPWRVVVAIPFTSIIEQTADQYRQALGPLAELGLVEHHSSLNPERDTRQNKLAAENWDAPLIVTTNVQLFESLFAAKTTPARKLHRLARSVIILDEAQTIPVDLLTPTLAALKELVTRYGCTVVLCTATQPALEHRPADFSIGLENVRPIIGNSPKLHEELKRVAVTRAGMLSNEQLVECLAAEPQVLCVVNTKAHAAKLYDELVRRTGKGSRCYHLSTFMCAQHRRDVLRRVRRILRRNALAKAKGIDAYPCRVISTQLVEAGVDVDFPCVYRAPAGFDSVAQAAGRCNREGRLVDEQGQPVLGRVYAFGTEQLPPPGLLRAAAQCARELSEAHPDPLAPSAVDAYFKLLYWSRAHEWDKHGVMACFDYNRADKSHAKLIPLKFRTAAEAYQLIRDAQTPILVPYDEQSRRMVAHVIAGRPIDYAFFRAAQRYTVSVRDQLLQKIADNASLVRHEAGLWALANPDAYSPEKGMLPDAAGFGPEALTI